MAQMKAPNINWHYEARRISSVIADMPDNSSLGLILTPAKWPPLHGDTKLSIELLQNMITHYLAYRTKVVHKTRLPLQNDRKGFFLPWLRDPETTAKTLLTLVEMGVKLQPVDLWAYDAHMKLGRILINRYVSKEWKREIPLIVASIGGATTSQTATLNSRQPRNVDRRSTLARAVSGERGHDSAATAWEVLDRLCGGDVVREHKDGRVWYWDHRDKLKSVGIDRFETIFSEQKPSTG